MSKASESNADGLSAFSGILTAHDASKITAAARHSRVSKEALECVSRINLSIKAAAEGGRCTVNVNVPNGLTACVEAYLLRNGYTVQGGTDFYWGRTCNRRADSLLTIKWKCYDKDKV